MTPLKMEIKKTHYNLQLLIHIFCFRQRSILHYITYSNILYIKVHNILSARSYPPDHIRQIISARSCPPDHVRQIISARSYTADHVRKIMSARSYPPDHIRQIMSARSCPPDILLIERITTCTCIWRFW